MSDDSLKCYTSEKDVRFGNNDVDSSKNISSKAHSKYWKREKCTLTKCPSICDPDLCPKVPETKRSSVISLASTNTLLEFGLSDGEIQSDLHHDDLASEYGDLVCGEPMKAQRLTMDFTARPGYDDNKEILQKCFDFWAFFRDHSELSNLMVEPEAETEELETQFKEAFNSEPSNEYSSIPEPSIFEWVRSEEINRTSFVTKKSQGSCASLEQGPYLHGSDVKKPEVKKRVQGKPRSWRTKRRKGYPGYPTRESLGLSRVSSWKVSKHTPKGPDK